MARRLGLPLLACLIATAACSAVLGIEPGEPRGGERPEVDDARAADESARDAAAIEPACAIIVDRTDIDFGEGLLNERQLETVTFQSFTSTPTVVNASVSGPGFGAEQPSVMVPANGKQTLNLSYQSATAQMATGAVTFNWAGSCTRALNLRAKTVAAGYAVSPGKLDLGSVACGSAPPPGNILVKATTGGAQWTASWKTTPGPFSLPVASGTLVAGTNTIVVQSSAVAPREMPHEERRVLTLSITGEATRDIVVVTKSLGAKITLDKTGVLLSTSIPEAIVTIGNAGNDPVKVVLSIPAPFVIPQPNILTIVPGTPQTFFVAYEGSAQAAEMLQISASGGTICTKDNLQATSTTAF